MKAIVFEKVYENDDSTGCLVYVQFILYNSLTAFIKSVATGSRRVNPNLLALILEKAGIF